MAEAAPKMACWGAPIVYAAVGAIASFAALWLQTPADSSSMWVKDPLTNLLCSGVAAISAAAAAFLLRPLFRWLAAYRYFLRPVVLGFSVTLVAHVLFAPIVVFSFEVWRALTQEHYRFETLGFAGMSVFLGYVGFIIAFSITLPLGVLAGYCVETLEWFVGMCRMRRQKKQASDDLKTPAE